jgi:transposase
VIEEAKRRKITPAKRGSLDGSAVAANASRHRLLNEEQLRKRCSQLQQAGAADAAGEVPEGLPAWMAKTPSGRVKQAQRLDEARARLTELQAAAARRQPSRRRPAEKIVISPSDPQAALGRDKMKVFRPLYNVQLVPDLDSTFILGYELFPQTGDNGTLKPMLKRLRITFGVVLEELLVDAAYVSASNLALARRHSVTLCGPWQENDFTESKKAAGKTDFRQPKFGKEKFQWLPDQNSYRCPEGHLLTAIGKEHRAQNDGEINTVFRYRCLAKHCRACPQRSACTTNPNRGRSLRRSEHEELIDYHKTYMQADATKALYKLRRQTVERTFAELKEYRNFERFSGRGTDRARRELALSVLAHNLTTLGRSTPQQE